MKRALLAVGLVIVLAAVAIGVVYAAIVRPILLPPPTAAAAESALVTPDVLVLGAVNVKQAVFLERWFLGAPVIPAAHRTLPPATDRPFVDHLRGADVDLRRDVDYALYALYPSDAPSLRYAVLLLGRFDVPSIEHYLARELGAPVHAEAGRHSYDVTRTDPGTCDAARPASPAAVSVWRVSADPGWILISDPGSHAALLRRLASAPTDSVPIVGWWRALSQWDVAGIGIWNLGALNAAAASPLLQTSARAVALEAAPFQRAYLGLGIQTTPPRGRLRVVLDADDAPHATQKIAAWEQAVAGSRARWAAALPSLGALYDRLSVRTNGSRSTIAFSIDRQFGSNLQAIGNELVGALFSGFNVNIRQRPAPEARAEERIDSTPFAAVPVVSPSALPAYDPSVQFAEEVDQIAGPFGVRLEAVRLGSEPGVGLELTVDAFANQIPNTSGATKSARLVIDSVRGSDGRELLRPEACGRDRNSEPVMLTDALPPRLRATKTVRLVAGADPHAIASVVGHLELRLATRTETVSLPQPRSGLSVRKGDATFTIVDRQAGAISYQISGPRERILAVRALNAKGQALRSDSSFAADFVFGEGGAGQTDYAGAVDRLDVVFATEERPLRFPFTLTDFSFTGKATTVGRDPTEAFEVYSPAAIRRALGDGRRAPVEVSLVRLFGFGGLMLDFKVRSAALPDFERAFSVGDLQVTRIHLTDGTVVSPTERLTWRAPLRFGNRPKDGVLSTTFHVTTDAKVRPEMVAAVEGLIAVQFPRSLETLHLDNVTPGQAIHWRDVDVTVTARGRRRLTLQASKEGHRVLYVRLLGGDGQALGFFGPDIVSSPDGAWRFELSPLSNPRAAEIVVVPTLYRRTDPFTVSRP